MTDKYREIPYNYTSHSDREVVWRFLGKECWDDLNVLRHQRRTGRSARMLFDILGDLWVVSRNAFLRHDLLHDKKRLKAMRRSHDERLARILQGAEGNRRALRLVQRMQQAVDTFHQWFAEEPQRRRLLRRAFAKHTHVNNIHFDAFSLTHSATDATDWRHDLPFCVLTPDHADELPGLIRVVRAHDLVVIPRGGGTGLCGGSVPLQDNSVMINVEKFDTIDAPVEHVLESGRRIHTIRAGAGAVTGQVMEASKPHVFATDPTSLWACTIGGNVASNAGGKHAVLWGTCVDNLLSWKMLTPDGHWLLVERLDHQMGKIPADQTIRFRLSRFDGISNKPLGEAEILAIEGSVFRRKGLGKDVTRKALGGLPGIQKEGTDGFITEATFVLHRAFSCTRTVCCEFFGHELSKATEAMVSIKQYVDAVQGAEFEGLEHFDEKYVKAIDYISKSTRRARPRVVLLIDISGDDESLVGEVCSEITRLASLGDGEGFIAISKEDRSRFWGDRGRMAAIARHTRAFKLNEDVVIPLDRLSEYNDFIEHLNIEHSISNKLAILTAVEECLKQEQERLEQPIRENQSEDHDGFLDVKIDECLSKIEQVRVYWQALLTGLDTPATDFSDALQGIELRDGETLFRVIQRGALRISWKTEIRSRILDRLRGHAALIEKVNACHSKVRSSRIVIATHMHAGDGNVHTNIPVNSNDYQMMHQAHAVVEKFMAYAESLGGVISGEHGIGITKLPYLNKAHLEEMKDYLQAADPDALFNRGKLLPDTDLTFAYTPSFNLLEMESVILEAADLTELADEISPCLRCGKCKPVCNTHFPRANMLYSPRNKIQATGSIIEALLFESQTGSGISFEQFSELKEVADHCTICHKCESPCPVNIDFGAVTERMRALLKSKGSVKQNLAARVSMMFLTLQHPAALSLMRTGLIDIGFRAQRQLHLWAKRFGLVKKQPAAVRNLEGVQAQLINFIERPLPKPPSYTARKALGLESSNHNMIPILRDPKRVDKKAVFYFPGCGSERLYSQIGLATEAMLFELGKYVVLPPAYLCCGYPSTASGDEQRGQEITYENRVLFHRLRAALSYLDFEAVVVSCGTCYDQLTRYHLQEIFPNAPLIDIHEYLLDQGVKLEGVEGVQYVVHEPCHTPLKKYGSEKVASVLMGQDIELTPQCCGEAGTMAVSSPDIAGKIRARKEEELRKASALLTAKAANDQQKVLTSCPSCLQGLARLDDVSGTSADYIVVEMAKHLWGEDWEDVFIQKVKKGGSERVLM